jgi:glycosyltransferase involved in cell wall biosynthesis
MSDPLVSVIIPLFNAQDFIRATLDSILSQSYENLEIIVIDDGSRDDSASIVLSYGANVRFISQTASGNAASPRNVGLKYSQGDLVAFFDADDLMQPNKIELQVAFLKRHPQVSVSLTDYINFSGNKESERSHFATCCNLVTILEKQSISEDCILQPELARWILAQENFGITSSFLLRRQILECCGGFDERVAPSEDFDLLYRIAMTHKIGILNRIGFKRRLHDNNTTNNRRKVLRGLISSREKLSHFETVPGLRKQLINFVGERYLDLSDHYIGSDSGLAMSSLIKAARCNGPISWRAIRLLVKMALSLVKPTRNVVIEAS